MSDHLVPRCILLVILVSIVFGCNSNKTENNKVSGRPNVILILTDDQGWGDLGIHGNKQINTPTIDQMASEGAQFERFYVSPLCAPTRASLLTGRYHLRTGTSWVSKGLENMNPKEVTIAEIFQNQGYKTGCFGKWHNGAHYPQHPNQQGFDEFIGFCAGHWNNYFSTTLEHNGSPYPTDGYISDVLTDEALSFIEANKDNQFFCYLPYNAPHGPFQVPDLYFDKYKSLGFNDKDATVYGMCENIDDNLARITRKVEQLGLAENTIIIFMTDNGPNGNRYNGGMRGIKGSVHEGGVRVPCVIKWKNKIMTKSIPEISGHIDILPTLVSLCDLEPPETLPLDGLDLSELLLQQNGEIRDRLFFNKKSRQAITPDGAARSDRYRFVIEDGDTMLFDMIEDPGQLNDIVQKQKEIVGAMALAYNKWFTDVSEGFMPDTEIRIGFEGESSAYLPSHEAKFSGEISFMEGHGWAHDWLVNWTQEEDSIYWEVVVDEDTEFNLELLYSCPGQSIGSHIIVKIDDMTRGAQILKAHDPEYLPSPDRIRRIEVYEKEWASLNFGSMRFPKGNQKIVLNTSKIANGEVGEIKGLILTKIKSL